MSFLAPRSHGPGGPGGPAAATISPLPYELPRTEYPMFVMKMMTFMELDILPDHQELLGLGDTLFGYDAKTMRDRIFFISHQCTLPHRTPCRVSTEAQAQHAPDSRPPVGPITHPRLTPAFFLLGYRDLPRPWGQHGAAAEDASDGVPSPRIGGHTANRGRLALSAFCKGPIHPTPHVSLAPMLRRLPLNVRTAQPYTRFIPHSVFSGVVGLRTCSSGGVASPTPPSSPPFLDVFQSLPTI